MYSRRPTSMPTWASAVRTVQRGCEPKAIDPLQREKRERGRFLVARDIGTKRDLFNKARAAAQPRPGRIFRPKRFSVVIRLLGPFKFVDPRKNSVDPPSNEFAF